MTAPQRDEGQEAGGRAVDAAGEGDGDGGSRYDDMAEDYVRFWAPVLHDAAIQVLDHVAPAVEGFARAALGATEMRLLDLGSGTGTLAHAALRRWPNVRVVAIDASAGMLEVARRRAAEVLGPQAAARLDTVVAFADELPRSIETFHAAISSFVLQLVPNRAAALREVLRVLRPGAPFAWVSWLRTDRAFEPDRVANDVLDEFGFDPPEPDPRPGDLASVQAAALGMRRAGFRDVRAWPGEVVHAWDAEGYLDFFTQFDEASLFADLEARERAEIEARILERLRKLSPGALTLRLPVVYVTGRRPG